MLPYLTSLQSLNCESLVEERPKSSDDEVFKDNFLNFARRLLKLVFTNRQENLVP